MLRIELTKLGNREFVQYTGTREALLASGVADLEMFPCVGYVRRYRPRAVQWDSASWFRTTRRGAEFVITRWRHWQLEPAQQERLRRLLASLSPAACLERPRARVISIADARSRREA